MCEPVVDYSRDADHVDPNALSTAFDIMVQMMPRRRCLAHGGSRAGHPADL
jgi:hypothetical protein